CLSAAPLRARAAAVSKRRLNLRSKEQMASAVRSREAAKAGVRVSMFEERVDNWADDRDTGVGYNPAFLKRVREKREAEEREIRKAEALRRRDAERSALEFARFLRMAPRAELRFRKLMAELSARNQENKITARPVSVKDIIEMTEIKYDLPKGSIC